MSEQSEVELRPGATDLRFAIAAIPGGLAGGVILALALRLTVSESDLTSGYVFALWLLLWAGAAVAAIGFFSLGRGVQLRTGATALGAWALGGSVLPAAWLLLCGLVTTTALNAMTPSVDSLASAFVILDVYEHVENLDWIPGVVAVGVTLSGLAAFVRWLWRRAA